MAALRIRSHHRLYFLFFMYFLYIFHHYIVTIIGTSVDGRLPFWFCLHLCEKSSLSLSLSLLICGQGLLVMLANISYKITRFATLPLATQNAS